MGEPQLSGPLSGTGSKSASHFLLARLHSLAGIVPLGLFLVEHFFSNAMALLGADAYNRQIASLQSIPFLPLIEILFIGLPLIYHAVYGIYLSKISNNNAGTYKYRRNRMFWLQRATGLITLVFVGYHLWAFRLSSLFFGNEVTFSAVSGHLQQPLIFIFYIAGILSVSYHFSNGVSTGLITWGITQGPKSQKYAALAAMVFFVIFSAVGIGSMVAFI